VQERLRREFFAANPTASEEDWLRLRDRVYEERLLEQMRRGGTVTQAALGRAGGSVYGERLHARWRCRLSLTEPVSVPGKVLQRGQRFSPRIDGSRDSLSRKRSKANLAMKWLTSVGSIAGRTVDRPAARR
jgi:hypothetical protein